jgi:menaquinol-cytochrome c reductase iron-sulfur subunit
MNNENPPDLSRRKFLNRLSIGLGVFGAAIVGTPVVAFLLDPLWKHSKPTWRPVGPVNQFTIGQTVEVKMIDPAPLPWAGKIGLTAAWLQRRSESEFVAFSVNCQHLGCPVRWEAKAKLFMCPCHGGVYYENGKVAGGPPPRPLQQYAVRVRQGQVEVRPGPIPMATGL